VPPARTNEHAGRRSVWPSAQQSYTRGNVRSSYRREAASLPYEARVGRVGS
jgi:hypothetical protein